MDLGRCPPQNAAGAASFDGRNPRFPMETGPVANPRPLDPCLSPDFGSTHDPSRVLQARSMCSTVCGAGH
eukprot:8152139-Pyramimonas_sp.AAC.1